MPGNGRDGPIDHLTQLDEIMAGPILDRLKSIDKKVGGSGSGGAAGSYEPEPRVRRTIDLSAQLAPFRNEPGEDQIEHDGGRTAEAPFDGWITSFICGWPEGAEQNTGIGLRHDPEDTVYFPSGQDNFAAFNDFNNAFEVVIPVEKGEEFRADFLNKNSTPMPVNALIEFSKAYSHEEVNVEGRTV